jgi:hypothetical protein
MSWKTERDLLIAQTMAFVQSVTGQRPDVEVKPNLAGEPAVEAAPLEAATLHAEEILAPAKDVQANIQIPRTMVASDVRTEMQARVANFRAHQERFHREREEYFSTTLTKARAGTQSDPATGPSDRIPPRG